MLTITIVATVVAAVSAVVALLALKHAKRSADAAEESLDNARRSADAAERSAGAAVITAEADRDESHRKRAPRLIVAVETMVEHDDINVIYRVTNEGSTDLDAVVVHRPILGDVEGRTIHPVARVGSDYDDEAEIGPIAMGSYGRFTLSLGPGSVLPEFRLKIVSTVSDESWPTTVLLDQPRKPPPPPLAAVASPAGVGRRGWGPSQRGF